MTALRQEAISIVKQFPEEHITILLQTLIRMQKTYVHEVESSLSESIEAYRNLQKYRKQGYVNCLSDTISHSGQSTLKRMKYKDSGKTLLSQSCLFVSFYAAYYNVHQKIFTSPDLCLTSP